MQFHKYARNAILYTVLFSTLVTTNPAPIVYAAPAANGQEQSENTSPTAVSQIRTVQESNKTLSDTIQSLQTILTDKSKNLPASDSELDTSYSILYSDYVSYKETLSHANAVVQEADAFVEGTDQTPGSTSMLNSLLARYISDSNGYLSDEDQQILDQLSNDIQTQQTALDALDKKHALKNLNKFSRFTLSDQLTALHTANEELKEQTDIKRAAVTDEDESKYTPTSYQAYKSAIAQSDTLYEATGKLIADIDTIVKEKNYVNLAKEYKITDTEDITYLKQALQDIATQLTSVASMTDQITSLNLADLVAQQTKYALKDAIDKASKYPPDEYTTYTSETYSTFQKCLEEANRVYNDGDATREQIRAAKEALLAAINGLVEVDRAYSVIDNTYYYNVNSFGAFGNDNIDDTSALQKALDQARDGVHVVITVPAGTYYISNVLYIQSNTTLNLDARATIYRSDSSLSNNMLKNSDAKHKSTGYKGYKLSQNITVNGGTWEGGNIYSSTKSTNLIYIGHADNVTITNATIKNCHGSHALEFAGVRNGTISNCTFNGFRFGSNSYTSEAIQLDICYKSGKTEWTPGFTMDKTTCKNILIENCNIVDYPRGIGSHHTLSGVPYENITIRNNTITRSTSTSQKKCVTGIFIMGAKNIKVSKNTVDGYSYGIWVRHSSSIKVKKNILKNNPTYNLVYDSNTAANKYVKFTVTKYKVKTKPLEFTAPTIRKGSMKTRGQTYRIKKVQKIHTVTLKKKLKKNQKVTFFGMDKDNNKFYRTYHLGK